MRLISLTANQATFKSVFFNRTGLTLIVGKHGIAKKTDLKKTYNGVGKSLLVSLINYCLGSNKNEHFDTHLPGWAFTLNFEHAGQVHQTTRTTGETKLILDGEEFALRKYQKQLTGMGMFQMPAEDVPYLTLPSLQAFFVRPSNSSYVKCQFPQAKWTDYQSILCQSFLLGLDYHRVVQKHDQKTRLDTQVELADRYKKDKDLREFYLGEKNAEVELIELGAQIEKLAADLSSFRVAENYAERQEKADLIHQKLATLSNESVMYQNLVNDLKLSLADNPDVSPEQVTSVFEEASVVLPNLIVKRLSDVQAFHQRLRENRAKRLGKELLAAEQRISDLAKQTHRLRNELDFELQFLNAHRALDEYSENSAKLSELRGREQRIKDYSQLLTQYTEEAQRIKAEMAQTTVNTNDYLKSKRAELTILMDRFREYSKELYGPVPAGLTVKNNDGENQCRFDIDVHIQNDAGDGINQAKIFCYDLLLLSMNQRHSMEFLVHDSRLYAHLDPRQRFSLFRLADKVTRGMNAQYIATVNEDMIDSVRPLAGDDFQRLFVDTVVLELTDAPGGSGKLLGKQIDMSYDE